MELGVTFDVTSSHRNRLFRFKIVGVTVTLRGPSNRVQEISLRIKFNYIINRLGSILYLELRSE